MSSLVLPPEALLAGLGLASPPNSPQALWPQGTGTREREECTLKFSLVSFLFFFSYS